MATAADVDGRRRVMKTPAGALVALTVLVSPGAGSGVQDPPPDEERVLGSPSRIDFGDAARGEPTRIEAGSRLRGAPDLEAPTLAIFDLTLELEALERRGDWVKVRLGERLGWVRLGGEPATVVTLPEAADSTGADPERLERARRILGPRLAERRLGPFLLLTDLDSERLLDRFDRVAARLPEAYRRRFGLEAEVDPDNAVVLFRRESDYRLYEEDEELRQRQAAGHAGRGVAALFVGRRNAEQVRPLLVHELTHLLNRAALGREAPTWLEEAVANDLGFCQADRDGRLRLGTLTGTRYDGGPYLLSAGPVASLRLLARRAEENRLIPFQVLLDLPRSEFVERQGRELRYIQSTFLVRYLLDADQGRYAHGFRSWISEVGRGSRSEAGDLLRRVGLDWPRLDRGFRGWVRSLAP